MNLAKTPQGRAGLSLALLLTLAIACNQIATPAQAEEVAPVDAVAQAGEGASQARLAVQRAARNYWGGDAEAVHELAEAASTTHAVPMASTSSGLQYEDGDGVKVSVTRGGAAEVSSPNLHSVGIGVEGAKGTTTSIAGSLVKVGVAPGTDLVTRATQDGVQLVAVLASSAASGRIRFRIDLPTGAHLSAKPDGSIAIIAPVRATVAKPGELARFEKDVRRIIGSATELSELSVDKRHAVAMVTPPATERRVVTLEVGVIGVPWALDANGDPLATHYEVKGDILEQVVEVEARTKYPVTADPSISVGFFETSVSFSKSEVKSLATKSSYYSIGAAACGVIPNAIVAVACGVYAAVVLTNIGNVISKAASKKQCARINFNWIPAINFPTYKSTTRYAC